MSVSLYPFLMNKHALGFCSDSRRSQAPITRFASEAPRLVPPPQPPPAAPVVKKAKKVEPTTLLRCGVKILHRSGPQCLCGVSGRPAYVCADEDARGKKGARVRVCGLKDPLMAASAPPGAIMCPMKERVDDGLDAEDAAAPERMEERPRCGCEWFCTVARAKGGDEGADSPDYHRRFFACARGREASCGTFAWIDPPHGGAPTCECGRLCAVYKWNKADDDSGRRYFACDVPRGQKRQCRFFVFRDAWLEGHKAEVPQ